MPTNKNRSSREKYRTAVNALRHPICTNLLQAVKVKGAATAKELRKTLKIEQSICSLHLGYLRIINIVKRKRKGKNFFYSINNKCDLNKIFDKENLLIKKNIPLIKKRLSTYKKKQKPFAKRKGYNIAWVSSWNEAELEELAEKINQEKNKIIEHANQMY